MFIGASPKVFPGSSARKGVRLIWKSRKMRRTDFNRLIRFDLINFSARARPIIEPIE
jgi:hypothetical protein